VISVIVGLALGLLVISSPYLPIASEWQKIVLVVPFVFAVVVIFRDLEKLILFVIAISVPLNLDFTVMLSSYASSMEASGYTIIALTGLRLSLILLVVVVGYFTWLVKPSNGEAKLLRFYPSTSIPALCLIFVSLLSIFQASDAQLAFFKIAQFVELFLVYLYLANHLRTKQELQFFIIVLISAMLAESILMIVQWRTGLNFEFAGIAAGIDKATRRAGGTLGAANTAGSIQAAQLALVCAMLWLFPKRGQKAFAVLCFLAGVVALISTAGRAAWGGFLFVILSFVIIGWWRRWVNRQSLVVLFLVTLIMGVIFYPIILNRLTGDDNGSISSRLSMYQLAWNIISSSPSNFFLGVGINNYSLVAASYNTFVAGALGKVIQNISVHNVFLLTWTEIGLVGLLCYISFLVMPLTIAWKYIRSNDRFVSLMALGIGSGFVVMILQMMVDPFVARPKMIFSWLLVALIVSLKNIEPAQPDSQNRL